MQVKLVVLDQNAICNLAFPPSLEWAQLRDSFQEKVDSGKILCPTPAETLSESTHLEQSERQQVQKLCDQLSRGIFIKFFWQLIADAVLAQVRPNLEFEPFWVPSQRYEMSEDENAFHARAIYKEEEEMECFVNSLEMPQRNKALGVEDCIAISAEEWLSTMGSLLNRFRNGHLIGPENFIAQQTLGTLADAQISDDEIAGLLRGIQSRSWLQIPLLNCWLSLDGLFLYDSIQRGRRFEYNDEWDKFRAAGAHHVADCFITDRGMASALRQLKFEDADLFRVFSVAEPQRIREYLEAL